MTKTRLAAFGLALSSLAGFPARGQPAAMIKDIRTTQQTFQEWPLYPVQFVEFRGRLYFTGQDGVHGRELWSTDGTPQGTRLVVDACPGVCNGSISHEFAEAGDRLFFVAQGRFSGEELWTTDGTAAGSRMVADLAPGEASSRPAWLTPLGNRVFFLARTEAHGWELWGSDGTAGGTSLVKDIWPGPQPTGFPRGAILGSASMLFLSADDGTHGLEPWVSDGSAGGTVMLRDVNPGGDAIGGSQSFPTHPWQMGLHDGRLLFSADDGYHGFEPWLSDGTPAGTVMLADLEPGPGSSNPRQFTSLGVFSYFQARTTSAGTELFRTDGTPGGTGLFADIEPTPGGSAAQPLTVLGGRLLFAAHTQAEGYELWQTDGTPGGTRLVRDIRQGPEGSLGWTAGYMRDSPPVNGSVVFAADDGIAGIEWWATDGTTENTVMLADLAPGPRDAFNRFFGIHRPGSLGSRAVFFAGDTVSGWEPRVTDGTPAGTTLLLDLDTQSSSIPRSAYFSFLHGLASLHGLVYFAAEDDTTGVEPWRTDGTDAGTLLIQDLAPAQDYVAHGSFPRLWTPAGNLMYLTAGAQFEQETEPSSRLLVTDGAPGGIESVVDAVTFPLEAHTAQLVFGRRADDGASDVLMSSDGAPGGAVALSGPAGFFRSFESSGANLFISATAEDGSRLLLSDGATFGLTELAFFGNSGECDGPSSLAADGQGGAFFAAHDDAAGCELWHSDGSPAGTRRIADVRTGPASSIPAPPRTGFLTRDPTPPTIVSEGGNAYFIADDGVHGEEPWVAAGPDGPVTLIRDICPGPCSSRPRELTSHGNGLFFSADDGSSGRELWTSNGVGATRVADLFPGPDSSDPHDLLFAAGTLYFAATDPVGGVEPWQSDGSAASTYRTQDIHPGGDSSSAGQFTLACPNVVFSANDGTHGFEPWALPFAQGIDVELANVILFGDQTRTACRQLSAFKVQLPSGADYVFRAGASVVLGNGVTVGGTLKIRIDPELAAAVPPRTSGFQTAVNRRLSNQQ